MKALVSIPKGTVFDTFFTPENIRLAEELGELLWHNGTEQMTESELAQRIGDCDTYVTLWKSPALTASVLDCAPNLKLLVHLGSTVVPFVSDEMWKRGIRVISGFDYFAESTAEGAIAYILAAQRRIPYYNQRLCKEGVWKSPDDYTDGLIRKTVGIVGYGGVGRYVAKMLSAFRIKLKVYDIREISAAEKAQYGIEQCSLEALFSSSDIISLHLPYNPSTHHLIDDRLLSMIKKNALLVNTARGSIIDQAAMTKHLVNGDFRAALDVLEEEPISPADPLVGLENVLLTPHQAGPTFNLRPIITEELLREAADFIDRDLPLKNEIQKEYVAQMSRH
ncbi:MAG: hydroxyacid dehydrogenase [Clostridia bacterium]|nr:hydroxyacid dehydrogenase [Clostridia bacterium]